MSEDYTVIAGIHSNPTLRTGTGIVQSPPVVRGLKENSLKQMLQIFDPVTGARTPLGSPPR